MEADVNFSFRSAFPRKLGTGEPAANRWTRQPVRRDQDTEVRGFRHEESGGISLHPRAKVARDVLADIFQECARQQRQRSPSDCTEALRLELRNDRGTQASRIEEIERAENAADYPEVAKLCRIITADTQAVLVDQMLAKRIESGHRTHFPSWRDIMENSVQIWASRLDPGKLPIKPVGPEGQLWLWIGNYDSFLGYMAGMLPLLRGGG